MSTETQTSPPGDELLDHLADLGGQSVPDEEAARNIAALGERIRAAVQTLKTLRFPGPGGVQRSVDELPWYVLIGAPGSGNSSLLARSGLRFPQLVTDGEPQLLGVGGTRYCDWWFSDEAVLLDTAGRYIAHEARARSDVHAGTVAWHGFLAQLKKYRPQAPLNGAIVTLSVTDLLAWNKPERQHFAAHVRMRLAELYAGLDARFPVYLLVTKMDMLAGFAEFFANLDAAGRAQVWGTTYGPEVDPIAIGRDYTGDFDALQNRLYAEMLGRIEEEPDPARRAAIYRFPQQFHALGPLLAEFLAMAFSTLINHHPLMLRGVYFTSATQTGRPVDRVMRTLEKAFKLERRKPPASEGAGHCHFLERLLREVIFPEAVLAVSGEPAGHSSPPLHIEALPKG